MAIQGKEPVNNTTQVMARPLSDLNYGEKGAIERIESKDLELALLKYGVGMGNSLIMSYKAPFGGPISICVNDMKLFIRKQDAVKVWVTPQ